MKHCSILLITFIFTFLLFTTQSLADTSNRVVAFVNNDIITLYELNNKIKEMTGKSSEELRKEDPQKFYNTRNKILEMLIDDKLAKEKIKKLKIEATQGEIDDYIEDVKKRNKITQEQLVKKLKEEGVTLAKFREKVKEDLERRDLIDQEVRSKVVITSKDILAYYRSHIEKYTNPETVQIASIFLIPDVSGDKEELNKLHETGEEILAKLKNGEFFGTLAKKYSNGPAAEDGGDLGTIPVSELNPKMRKIINGLDNGGVSGLIEQSNGIQIIKLIKRTKRNITPLGKVKDKIFEILYNKELSTRLQAWIKEMRDSSYIKKIL